MMLGSPLHPLTSPSRLNVNLSLVVGPSFHLHTHLPKQQNACFESCLLAFIFQIDKITKQEASKQCIEPDDNLSPFSTLFCTEEHSRHNNSA